MAKFLVIGSYGQLGNEFQVLASYYPQHQFDFVDRDVLDITNEEAVQQKFNLFQPEYCINCAAYTAVDKAETEAEAASSINATAVKYLATACAAHQTSLVHISTDYVFDGTATTPYKEDDKTAPTSVYGETKLKGEEYCLTLNPKSIVIRTSWVYSRYGNNFVKTMLHLMQSKPEINVVADQQGSPTYAADLASAIMYIIESGKWQSGIYHFSNDGVVNWFHFAETIRQHAQLSCAVHPIKTEEYPTPAKRPKYSVMSKEKIQATFGLQLIPWEESLKKCLSLLQN